MFLSESQLPGFWFLQEKQMLKIAGKKAKQMHPNGKSAFLVRIRGVRFQNQLSKHILTNMLIGFNQQLAI